MAMGKHCPVLQVVGFQNSGKTTVTGKLIRRASQIGLQTAALKHHGHGGDLASSAPAGKDSTCHKEAGAFLSGAAGSGQFQLEANAALPLSGLIELYQMFEPDLIVVEGYKQEHHPKVVLLRDTEDVSLLRTCTNILCTVSPSEIVPDTKIPNFPPDREERYLDFILNRTGVLDEDGTF
ncbi:molybdopterin-guanine dinucleotide biosynthesis protein B [Salibacterium sp. K-3]